MSRFVDYFATIGVVATLEKWVVQGEDTLPVDAAVVYRPVVLDRLPLTDYDDAPMPAHIWMFCMPGGLRPIAADGDLPAPTSFVFALTETSGAHFYCACLNFYEQSRDQRTQRALLAAGFSDTKTLVPKSICLISRYPYFNALRSSLRAIYFAHMNGTTLPEKVIANILFEVPAPADTSCQIVLQPGPERLYLRRPPAFEPAILDFSLQHFFQALSIRNILTLLACVLTEQKILFLSSQYSLLTLSSEALLSLIWPFRWTFVYVPVLPRSMLQFLNAPTPFIMGVHASYAHERPPELPEVVVVDLDNNTVVVPERIPALPEPERSALHGALRHILQPAAIDTDNILPRQERHAEDFDDAIRIAFLDFFASLFAPYRSCVALLRAFPSPVTVFHRRRFLQDRPKYRTLLQKVLESSLFNQFLDEFDAGVWNGLDARISHLGSPLGNSPASVTIEIPAPEIVVDSRRNEVFPALSMALVGPPRSTNVPRTTPEGPRKYAVAIADEENISEREPRVDDALRKLFNQRVLSDIEFNDVSTLLQTSRSCRIYFAKTLAGFATRDAGLEPAPFTMIAALAVQLLEADQNSSSVRRAAQIMVGVATGVHRNISGSPEFLSVRLKGHVIWKDMTFWENLFVASVVEERMKTYGPDHADRTRWSALPPTKREAVEREEDGIIFSVLATMSYGMLSLGLTIQDVLNFVHKRCGVAGIKHEQVETLKELARNMARVHQHNEEAAIEAKGRKEKDEGAFMTSTSDQKPRREVDELWTSLIGMKNKLSRPKPVNGTPKVPERVQTAKYTTMTLNGHIDGILDVSVGAHAIVSGGMDALVGVWRAENGEELGTLKGHGAWVTAVEQVGLSALSASYDRTLMHWNTETLQRVSVFVGHQGSISCLAVCEDTAVTGGSDRDIKFWDLRSKASIATLRAHDAGVSSVCVGAPYVVSTGVNGALAVHDLRTQRRLWSLSAHSEEIRASLIGANGLSFTASVDGTARAWETSSGVCKQVFSGHTGAVNCMTVDGSVLITGGADGTVRTWNISSGRALRPITKAHSTEVTAVASVCGKIISGSADGSVWAWEQTGGEWLFSLDGHTKWISAMKTTADSVVTASWDATVRLWTLPRPAQPDLASVTANMPSGRLPTRQLPT